MAENWIKRAQQQGTPLVDGNLVSFVYQGKTAPRLIGDFNHWEAGGMDLRRAGRETWIAQADLPDGAYCEYAFLLGKERLPDPFNRRVVSNGMGKYNHYFYMPGAGPAPETRPRRGIPRGTVVSETIQADYLLAGGKRRVHFYQPAFDTPSPLLVVWDGQDYYRRAGLPRILDALIHAGRIPPLALAMVEHGRQARMLEYGCSDITVGFALGPLLERASQVLNLVNLEQQPGAFGVLGASMGGVMSLYTGLRAPQVFGKVLAQSGAFSLGEYDLVVWDLARSAATDAPRIWFDVGQFEELLEPSRRMAALLQQRGFVYEYHEYAGGHNYTCWQNDLIDGLIYAFGA